MPPQNDTAMPELSGAQQRGLAVELGQQIGGHLVPQRRALLKPAPGKLCGALRDLVVGLGAPEKLG